MNMAGDPFEVTGHFTLADTTLAYREKGADGTPVVFVHGGLSDLRTWEKQLQAISASYRTISYSRRYARPNDDVPAGADDQMFPHADDLAAILQGLDGGPATLVGNSWGAFICLLTAIGHPGLVANLVLEEPPVLPLYVSTPPRPAELLRLARKPRTLASILGFGTRIARVQKAFRNDNDEEAMRLFVNGVLGKKGLDGVPAPRQQQMRENLGALKAQMLGAGFPPLHDQDVREVTIPVLLLTGEQSPAFLHRLTERLNDLLPNAQIIRIPRASHLMHEENHAAVNTAILEFLTAQTPSTS